MTEFQLVIAKLGLIVLRDLGHDPMRLGFAAGSRKLDGEVAAARSGVVARGRAEISNAHRLYVMRPDR